nr:GNAT family N-acetyltransferase [Streptomyces scabichelini]
MTRLSAASLLDCADGLADLLADVVDGGSSVGFLAPLDRAAAAAWWRALAPELDAGRRAMWIARDVTRDDGRILGTVGVAFSDLPNGRHRAEIVKLMVHRDGRGRGLGRTLLTTAERAAADAGVTLLVLDTETGSPAESLYRSAGWSRSGVVPDYATDPHGILRSTTIYYKNLRERATAAGAGSAVRLG